MHVDPVWSAGEGADPHKTIAIDAVSEIENFKIEKPNAILRELQKRNHLV